MCGICGIVDYKENSRIVNTDTIRLMCREMKHRGPDDEGVFINKGTPCVGLGHRRLSIIDLSTSGHQPMSNEDNTIWVVFNGEIYNYNELRPDLEKKGHKFKSHTDSETVIHLYEEHGEECVKLLRGMFAFAIWDSSKKILLLARDRVGKKPLLYSYTQGRLGFASEFSALLESGLVDKEINPQAVDYYLTFGYIPAPWTIYKGVFKLPPAHTLIMKDNNLSVRRYWDLEYTPKIKISEEEACEEILILLKEAVKIRLYSDVPLGAFLSGGVDSSTVVGLMSEISSNKVKTFSVGFEERDYSELRYARNIACRFGTDHHEFIVKPQALEILPLLVERYGEPYADSSCIPTYYVARQTKQYVTVALNGDGGDECFAGYERYQAMLIANMFQKIPYPLKTIVEKLAQFLPDSGGPKNKIRRIRRFLYGTSLPLADRYTRWVSIFPDDMKKDLYTDEFLVANKKEVQNKLLHPFFEVPENLTLIDIILKTDVNTYLPNDLLVKMDIASMANALEARSPFLDHKVMEFAAKLPAGYKIKRLVNKYILKKSIEKLIPPENIHRKKMGFGVPVEGWMRSELRAFLYDTLLSKTSLSRGYFKPETVKDLVQQHISRHKDHSFRLWALLMFELWHLRFID